MGTVSETGRRVTDPRLHIAKGLSLPLDLITDRVCILATTGAGKTYLMRVIVEEVLKARQQVVVLDPKGDFWGLRSTVDGKGPGFPIPVFGGEHADLPLEEGSGKFIAELIVKERLSAILDVSLFSKGKAEAWATDFAEAFYHRNREAMMLAIDEAHTFAPQKFKGRERMLGAFTDLVTKGRKRGIGTLLASQRSALLNKDVLDLTATLIVLRTGSSRDRDAIDGWIEYNATAEVRRQIMGDLPKLNDGEAWIYSPHSFKLLERVQIREAETFDSSATPKPGQAVRKPKTLAEIDVGAVSAQMGDAIERAKADDPKELRKQVADLKRQLAAAPVEEKIVEVEKVVEKLVIPISFIDSLKSLIAEAEEFGEYPPLMSIPPPSKGQVISLPRRSIAPKEIATPKPPPDGELSAASLRILSVLQQMGKPLSPAQIGILLGLKPRGGHWNTAIAALRDRDLIQVAPGAISMTLEGDNYSTGYSEPMPTTIEEMVDLWKPRLKSPAPQILDLLLSHGELTNEEIGEKIGIATRGGYWNTARSVLREAKLAVPTAGGMKLAEELLSLG